MLRRPGRLCCRLQHCLLAVSLWGALCVVALLLRGRARITTSSLREADKCPVCFGHTACYMLHTSNVDVATLTSFSLLTSFANVKNVFYGRYRGRHIVLKKLAHDAELRRFDRLVCNGTVRCAPRAALYTRLLASVFPDLSTDPDSGPSSATLRLRSDVSQRFPNEPLSCPSRRFLTHLYSSLSDESQFKFFYFSTMLLINAEPLFLQAFSSEQGWPFPRYMGACGRLVFEQYIGPTLTSYHSAAWRQRVELALQLLEIADMLTSNELEFNLYLTDVTADNLAVDEDGRLIIVDVEDIVVVDRRQVARERPPGWNVTHVAPILCRDCMGYEPEQLCTHRLSDHNLLAVCKGLLATDAFARGMPGGLLHDPPAFVTSSHPELADWLRLCADPTPSGGSRFEPAANLRHTLNRVLSEEAGEPG